MHSIPQRRKRLLYVLIAFILSITLLVMAILDLFILEILKRPDLTTHRLLSTVLHLNVIALFLSFLSILHSLIAQSHIFKVIAVIVGGLSLATLIQRVTQELLISDYYPTDYAYFSR